MEVPMLSNIHDWKYYCRAASVILGGVLVHLTLGTIYTFGNMNPYFTSYIRAYSSPADLTYTQSIWIFACAASGQGLAMFVGGMIATKLGHRWTVLLGGWLSSLGIFLTFFTIKHSMAVSVLTYGIMFGLGVGIAYAPPLAVAMKWLPKKKGLVNGIVLAGFGGGAFIFNQVQTVFINPHNKSPDLSDPSSPNIKYFSKEKAADVLANVPKCYLLLGGCYAALQLIGALLIQSPPEESLVPDEDEPMLRNVEEDSDVPDIQEDVTIINPYQPIMRSKSVISYV